MRIVGCGEGMCFVTMGGWMDGVNGSSATLRCTWPLLVVRDITGFTTLAAFLSSYCCVGIVAHHLCRHSGTSLMSA